MVLLCRAGCDLGAVQHYHVRGECNRGASAVAQLRSKTIPETLVRRDTLWTDVEAQLIVNEAPTRAGHKGRKPAKK